MGSNIGGHTPGPWRSASTHGEYVIRSNSNQRYIAGVVTGDSECRANAHLIAAAPELYKFAKSYVHWIEIGATPEKHLYDMAKEALAKARQP